MGILVKDKVKNLIGKVTREHQPWHKTCPFINVVHWSNGTKCRFNDRELNYYTVVVAQNEATRILYSKNWPDDCSINKQQGDYNE